MKLRKLCQGIGFTMLLFMSGMGNSHPVALILWLAASVALLLAGRSFSFQKPTGSRKSGHGIFE